MIIASLTGVPLLAGLAAFIIRSHSWRRALLLVTALAHAGLAALAAVLRPAPILNGWFGLDAIGFLFLSVTSVLFLAAAVYGVHYLATEPAENQEDPEGGLVFSNAPEARFTGCLLLFLASMTLVAVSRHFGVIWAAVEATTLASAPLIYFHRHHRSLEATWKYLLTCSVGIAVALLGNFFLAVAGSVESGQPASLLLTDLTRDAAVMNVRWLHAAFLLFIVGYGTKMGLAPMHTWLPDAHSESPSVVSALLSGALLNCAFLGILRVHQVCAAAGQAAFSQGLFAGFGLFSLFIAAVFIIGQTDYKRLLAYSSVEHMGILALGVGIGGIACYGSMLHVLNHSFSKAMLFLLAGNILRVYRTKLSAQVQGVMKVLPVTGVLWVAGFFAIVGFPPFGTFASEFIILKGALDGGRFVFAAAYVAVLSVIFVGMARVMIAMAQGEPFADSNLATKRESVFTIAPSLVLGLVVLLLGVYIPGPLKQLLEQAAALLGGS